MSDVQTVVASTHVRACGSTVAQVICYGPHAWIIEVPHEELRAALARTGFGSGPFDDEETALAAARRIASAYGDYLEARDAAFRVLEQALAREFPP